MAVVAVVAAKGRGATISSLAMALAHRRPTLLAECDPSGGTIRHGFLQGRIPPAPDGQEAGLSRLAVADRQDRLAEVFEQNLVQLDADGHRQLLPGLTDPRQASTLAGSWEHLAQLLAVMDQHAGYDVIIDAGRVVLEGGQVHPVLSPAALLRRADLVLLVVPGSYWALEQAQPVAAALREELGARSSGADALGLLLIEQRGYTAHEVAAFMAMQVLGLLPWDRNPAQYLAEGGRAPRGFVHSQLIRAARTATDRVEEVVQRRRVHLQWGTARPQSPVVAGVVERLRHQRGVAARA